MPKYFVTEYAFVQDLNLPIRTGIFENDEFDEEFKETRFLTVRQVIQQAVYNDKGFMLVYIKDASPFLEWYTIENGFLVYNDIENFLTLEEIG